MLPSRWECGVSRAPSPHIAYRTANEKDFSLPLEMTMREGGTLPPSHGRRCPEGAEVGSLPKRDEKNGKQPCSRFVIPSAAEGSFSFAVFFFLCTYICMKHRASKSLGVRCFPCPLSSHCLPDRKRKRFLASARNDDAGRRHTPSFPWKEVPRRGGSWLTP